MSSIQPQRRVNLFDVSRRSGLDVPVDFRYEHFFNFLRLSQSYWLAHKHRKKIKSAYKAVIPPDFEAVLSIYDAFGDVTHIGFDDWWANTAQYQFGIKSNPSGRLLLKMDVKEHATTAHIKTAARELENYLQDERPTQGNRAMVVVALPIHANRVVMTYEFDRLLNQSGLKLREPREIYPFSLLNNKIRTDMMETAYRVAMHRAANPNMKLLDIGLELGISPATYNENMPDYHYERRRNLESMISRYLRKAHQLAENAARGIFPSLAPLAGTSKTFDWKLLEQQYKDYF